MNVANNTDEDDCLYYLLADTYYMLKYASEYYILVGTGKYPKHRLEQYKEHLEKNGWIVYMRENLSILNKECMQIWVACDDRIIPQW
jgi:hypothetical protein